MIRDFIIIYFLANDCFHGCYKAHPYCEPCGKSDYSWNYLIDELKESAGQWLSREAVLVHWSGEKIFQQIGKVIYPYSTINSGHIIRWHLGAYAVKLSIVMV